MILVRIGFFCLGAFCLTEAFAQEMQETFSTVHYQGHIDVAGDTTFDGLLNVQFYLVTDPHVGLAQPERILWSEYHDDVSAVSAPLKIYAGDFSVELGSVAPLRTSLFTQHAAVYVGMAVLARNENGQQQWVDLSEGGSRPRLLGTPFSISAKESFNFKVTGQLTIGSSFEVRGNTVLNAGLEVGKAPDVAALDVEGPNTRSLLMNGHRIDANGALEIQTDSQNEAEIGGDLTILGNLSAESFSSEHMQLVPAAEDEAYMVWIDRGHQKNGRWVCEGNGRHVRGDPGRGTSRTQERMRLRSRSFCFLTRTEFCDLSTENEISRCFISPSGDWWMLNALASEEGSIFCEARCLEW